VDLAEFEASLQKSAPPVDVHGALEALWHERRAIAFPQRALALLTD